MSRGQNPLIWMMAVSLPSAGHALGLGEIHVDSALNEPLAAEIDIVGATADDLIGLKAQVANRETFQQFGADRPNFLNTTSFKVTTDAKGHPVLSIRSSQAFTEPLVNFVVDLRWHNGELIRQYSLLLDPAGFPAATRVAAALPVPPTQALMPAPVVTVNGAPLEKSAATPAPAAESTLATEQPVHPTARKTTHLKVGAKATLRGVAWRVGARSESDLKQLMLAIFRANPSAFDGNINVMRLGALLTIPSSEDVALIPKAEANREIHAQMLAWRSHSKSARAGAPARPLVAPQSAPVTAKLPVSDPVAPAAKTSPETPLAAPSVSAPASAQTSTPQTAVEANAEHAELTSRVQSLESNLQSLQAELEATHNKMLDLQAQARYAEQHAEVAAPAVVADSHPNRYRWMAGIAGFAALAGLCLALVRRLKRRRDPLPAIPVEAPQMMKVETKAPVVAKPLVSPAPRSEARIELPELDLDRPEVGTPEPTAQTLADNEDTAEVDVRAALEAASERDEALARQPADEQKHEEELARLRRIEDEATQVREAIAAAWSIPDADTYQRFDDTETTLADALKRSMEDTVKLKQSGEPHEETMLDAGETMVQPTETALLPVATVNMQSPAVQQDAAATLSMTAPAPAAKPVRMESTKLDYNLVDLDQTNQHVHMPSGLHEQVVVKERRTNLVDVLKVAIEKEPNRSDLRMKLLETYYAAAATNRQGFLEAIAKLAEDRGTMSDEEWTRVQQMARHISADTVIPPPAEDDEDLANCA